MKYEPVRLTLDQRRLVESAIAGLCTRYNWHVHAIAVQSDHVHVVLSADREGEPLREAIKASASRALNNTYGRRKSWASNGSAKHLWETDYFRAAVRYVKRQRDY